MFPSHAHLPSTLGAGVHVPFANLVRSTSQAQSAYEGIEAGRSIPYHSTHYERNDVLAVGARHALYTLPHEATPLIDIRLITARPTPIDSLLRHYLL